MVLNCCNGAMGSSQAKKLKLWEIILRTGRIYGTYGKGIGILIRLLKMANKMIEQMPEADVFRNL